MGPLNKKEQEHYDTGAQIKLCKIIWLKEKAGGLSGKHTATI